MFLNEENNNHTDFRSWKNDWEKFRNAPLMQIYGWLIFFKQQILELEV